MAELEKWRQVLDETAKIISVIYGKMSSEADIDRLLLFDVNRNELLKERRYKCHAIFGIGFWRTEKGQ